MELSLHAHDEVFIIRVQTFSSTACSVTRYRLLFGLNLTAGRERSKLVSKCFSVSYTKSGRIRSLPEIDKYVELSKQTNQSDHHGRPRALANWASFAPKLVFTPWILRYTNPIFVQALCKFNRRITIQIRSELIKNHSFRRKQSGDVNSMLLASREHVIRAQGILQFQSHNSEFLLTQDSFFPPHIQNVEPQHLPRCQNKTRYFGLGGIVFGTETAHRET